MPRRWLAILALAAGCAASVDDPPVAEAGIDRFVPAGETVALVGAADREADAYAWTVAAGPGAQALADGGNARALFRPSEPGTYVLALEVYARGARSDPDYVQVTAIDCDRDGDGSKVPGRICRGNDCNDFDPAISPHADDPCEDGIDQDCDGSDERCCPRDFDGDGYVTVLCPGGTDCNDTNPQVNPGVLDICNGADDDCNGLDDGRDCPADLPCEDGHCGCRWTIEICDDGRDQDCDGADLLSDEDGDGHKKLACGGDDCDDHDQKAFPPHPETGTPGGDEICGNGKDENCDGIDPPVDEDGDMFPAAACRVAGVPPDCNDHDASIHPGAADLCPDGIDQNCDGHDALRDADFDGHVAVACGGDDCDDANPWVCPGLVESCNGLDDDCNGTIDDLPPLPCGPAIGAYPVRSDGGVGEWLILGPVRLTRTCWDENTVLPGGEQVADPAPGDGAFGLRWKPYQGGTPVDLGGLRTGSTYDYRSAAYLFTRIVAPAPAHYEFRLEASEAAALWIDGVRRPLPATATSCNRTDLETAVVYLSAGVHRVLVRTGTDGGPWNVKLRLFTPETAAPGPDRAATELRVDNGVGSSYGSCLPGTLVCDPATGEAVCVDFVGPSPESCATAEDDDCDGVDVEPDEDFDGIPAPGCELAGYAGPADCNDHHRQVGPGQPERCDAEAVDENCDGVANDLPPSSCGSGPTTFLSPTGSVEEWLVLGPIDTPGLATDARLDRRDLTAVLGGTPEAFARAFPGQVVGPFAWTPVEVPAGRADGWVDLVESLPGRDFDRTTTLGLVTLWIGEEADYRFDVTAGGALQVQLDGAVLRTVDAASVRQVASAAAHLAPGPHRLLVKVTSLASTQPGLGVQVYRDGAPARGVGVDVGQGVLRGACIPGVRTCGAAGWSGCVGAFSAVPEKCNRLDDDCDGVLPPGEVDADGDGLATCEGDCDDARMDPVVRGPCAGDADCVGRYGTGWRCALGDRCFRCGPP